MSGFQESGLPFFFVQPVHWNGDNWRVKEEDNYPFTSVRMSLPLEPFSALLLLLISSVCTEQLQICVKNLVILCVVSHKTCAIEGKTEVLIKSADLLKVQRPLQTNDKEHGNLLCNHQRVQNFSIEEQLTKWCTDAGFVKTVTPGQFFMTKDDAEFSEFDGHVGLSRVYITTGRCIGDTQRMDSWKHENWSCIGSY